MTINVEELIKQLGECYQDIYNKGLIPYKIEPGDEDDDYAYIDLKQNEGLFLTFENNEYKRLFQISLTLEDEKKTDWIFPNEIPFSLESVMTQHWVRTHFGLPISYGKPKPDGITKRGATEIYPLLPPNQNIAIQIFYNFNYFVERMVFYSIEHAMEVHEIVEKLRREGGVI